MRAFIAACFVAGVIAVGAAAILDNFVQEPVSVAFAEPTARVQGSREATPSARLYGAWSRPRGLLMPALSFRTAR